MTSSSSSSAFWPDSSSSSSDSSSSSSGSGESSSDSSSSSSSQGSGSESSDSSSSSGSGSSSSSGSESSDSSSSSSASAASSSSSGSGSSDSSSTSGANSSSSSGDYTPPGPEPDPCPCPPGQCPECNPDPTGSGGGGGGGGAGYGGGGGGGVGAKAGRGYLGGGFGGSYGRAISAWPVSYQNGEIRLAVTDIASGGFGTSWQHQRSYSNQLTGHTDVGQGYNWLVTNWPYVLEKDNGSVAVVRSNLAPMWFDLVEGEYVGLYGTKSVLTHDVPGHQFIVSMPDGTRMEFHDFDQTTYPQGAFKRQVEAGGDVTSVHNYADGDRIGEIRRTGTVGGQPLTEAFVYDYDPDDDRLTSVTLRRQLGSSGWEDVLRALYEYYDGLEDHGSLGDLKRVLRQVPTSSGWADTEICYYRYYVDEEEDGFVHGLKFVVEPATYAKMVAASQNPLTATDGVLATYADNYFEYDNDDRVVLERVDGGSRTFTFDYTESGFADGPNAWKTKTIETNPDGTQNVVYANFLGQAMLFLLRAPGSDPNWKNLSLDDWDGLTLDELFELDLTGPQEWARYTRFNDDNRPVLFAYPSAIAGYNDEEADLDVELYTDAGLIELTEYYETTGSGAVEGYVSARKIQNGAEGTEILLQSLEYTSHNEGDATIFPVSKTTVYRNDNGTGEIETSYAYTYHSGTTQIAQRTTIWPVIPTEQNGTGIAATRKDYFDINGRNTWSMDERGYITHRVYDLGTGAVVQQIDDVDTSIVSGAPSGWTTPGDGGKNLVTDYGSDDQGRTTQVLGPAHTIDIDGTATEIRRASWMVYDDVNHVTYSGNGYETQDTSEPEYVLINPVSITKQDAGGKVLEQIQAVSAETEGTLAEIIEDAGSGAAAFPQSSYSRWTTTQYIDCCLAVSQRAYHTIPASGAGTAGANYDQTNYGYDVMKRRNRTVTPGGTITRTVFDARGLTTSTWVGTNDAGATADDPSGNGADPDNNMVVVTSNVYDDDEPGLDGNLTRQTQHVDATTGRVTSFVYDWRNRRVDSDGEIDFFQRVIYDNLSRVVETRKYDTTSAGNLIAKSETRYDDRGRVFRTIRYGVNPSTGVVGNSLTDNTWFDDSGNVLDSLPSGSKLSTKAVYDSLGRRTVQYLGYTPGSTGSSSSSSGSESSSPDSVANDVILEQLESVYDDASNVIESISRQRYHNAPATQLGPLEDPANDPKARVTYAAMYPDAIGRMQATANYGTNGGIALTRSDTIPTPSDDILVSLTAYDEAGNTLSMTDPAGMVTRTGYDELGRVIEQIQNYRASPPSSSSSSSSCEDCCEPSDDVNVTVQTSYNADGNVETLTAINAATGNQVTTYVYGTTLEDSGIASSTLKRKEVYPDSVDEDDVIAFTYNRQRQVTTQTDQNGTVHSYDYDLLGRMTQDRVTTVGEGIDDTVLRIGTTYEVRGLREKVTSYDDATVGSGNVLNEVQSTYNNFGQLITEYQQHEGWVNVGTTPKVQYDYADGSQNTIRQTLLVYPNGRELTYSYGDSGSIEDAASRVLAIIDDDDTHLVEYQYLGRGTFVVADDTEPQVKWTLVDLSGSDDPDTGDIYIGLDRFGRIKDSRWYNYDVEEDIDRLQYGYDRASNRIWRANLVAQSLSKEFDEIYSYDGIHRLKHMGRGLLNGTQTALTSQTFAQCWTLDSTGNWSGMKEADTGGSWTLEQTRTASEVNEITDITNTVGTAWAQPEYDAAGNMTTMPQPKTPPNTYQATYDAWNRIVLMGDNDDTVAHYKYDGVRRRIVSVAAPDHDGSSSSSGPVAPEDRHIYFTPRWQMIEERVGTAPSSERQYVWGVRYIDDCLLRDRDTCAATTSRERLYSMQDPNWNVVAILGPDTSIAERYAYSSYGETDFLDSQYNSQSASSYHWTTLYASYQSAPRSGLLLARNRVLHSSLAVWTSRDPLRYADSPSFYQYARSNPLNFSDPSGLVSIRCECGCPGSWFFLTRVIEEPIDCPDGGVQGCCDQACDAAAKYIPTDRRNHNGRTCHWSGNWTLVGAPRDAQPVDCYNPVTEFAELERQAERRRGSSGDDSGHHCWAVCMYTRCAPLPGVSQAACIVPHIAEALAPSTDWFDDMQAHHEGAKCAVGAAMANVSCDECCGTRPIS